MKRITVIGRDFDMSNDGTLFSDGKRYRQCHVCMRNIVDIDKNDYVACDDCVSRVKNSPQAMSYLKAFKKELFKMLNLEKPTKNR